MFSQQLFCHNVALAPPVRALPFPVRRPLADRRTPKAQPRSRVGCVLDVAEAVAVDVVVDTVSTVAAIVAVVLDVAVAVAVAVVLAITAKVGPS